MEQITAVVDFGSSHTVVVVAGPGIPARLVPVDGEPWFPSAVFWDRDGRGVVGRDALRLGRVEPARLERRPKARIGEGQVLLGDAVVPTFVLVRTVLVRAIAEAVSAVDAVVAHLVLTHPADWGPTRLGTLVTAAQGLVPRVSTMAEPVAAAAWFAARHALPVGAVLAVLDLGGGTCDAALVRREPTGLAVAACAGLPDLGGEDLDQRIVEHLAQGREELAHLADGARLGEVPAEELAGLARFRDGVRAAKEALSRHPQADVPLPGHLPDVLLTRAEFEARVRPDLARAVELLDTTVRSAGLTGADLAAVQLVGGSSRVPLLAQLLRAWTDAPVRLDDQPEAVVALGAEVALRPQATAPPDPDVTGPVRISELDLAGPPAPEQPRQTGARAAVVAVAILAVAVLGLAALIDVRGFGGTVAGSAQAPPGGPRLTLPAAATGERVSVPGGSTAALRQVERGRFIDYVHQDSAVRWRLDSFDDSPDMHRTVSALGNGLDAAYHWALVRYTVRAVDALAGEPDLDNQVHLVDDRGLMLSPVDSFKGPANQADVTLPDYCLPPVTGPVPAGTELARCALFAVPDATPVTEVAIAYHSNGRPLPSLDEATRTRGARVAVSGRDTGGAEPATVADAHPPGGTVSMQTNQFSAEVSVVGLVEDASRYLTEDTTIILGGSRATVLRIAVRLAEPTPASSLVSFTASLLDDRGAPIDPSVTLLTNECLNTRSDDEVSGTVALCVLFAVPAEATPRAAIVQAAPGTAPEIWRLP